MTAGIVNLVPEGLILLISLTAAVSAFKMAKRGVLAQQLNAVESLASVDVVCTDKTGTLTEAALRVVGLIPAGGVEEKMLARAVATYAASAPSRNLTLAGDRRRGARRKARSALCVGQVPFSSRRRWSALDLGDERLILGAPERFVAPTPALVERAAREASSGRRVLALGRIAGAAAGGRAGTALPGGRAGARARRPGGAPQAERRRDGRLLRRPAGRPQGALGRRAGDRRARSLTTPACRVGAGAGRRGAARPSRRRCARRSCPRPPSAASRRTASGRSWTR